MVAVCTAWTLPALVLVLLIVLARCSAAFERALPVVTTQWRRLADPAPGHGNLIDSGSKRYVINSYLRLSSKL